MNRTNIEYLTHTWNPFAMRCTRVSDGCRECWHLKTLDLRFVNNRTFSKKMRRIYAGKEKPLLVESRLIRLKKENGRKIIGVQFMGDLFHEDISFNDIDIVFEIMFENPQHIYVILTKRAWRMREYFNTCEKRGYPVIEWQNEGLKLIGGITVEDQKAVDRLMIDFLSTPFKKRFVSAEPMLDSIDLENIYPWEWGGSGKHTINALTGEHDGLGWIDCVVCGGENSAKARPIGLNAVRDLRDQCEKTGTMFFFKGWGSHCYLDQMPPKIYNEFIKKHSGKPDHNGPYRLARSRSGRLLDGRTWDEFPTWRNFS